MKLKSRRFVSAILVVLPIAALHCDATDVVVAEIPQSSDGGNEAGPPRHGMPCATSADCHESDFCEKHDCQDALGQCHQRPVFCDSNGPFPVCGCDNVTYWNDCLRKAGGVSAASMGECENGATCGGPNKETCPAFGASCAHLFFGPPGPCSVDAPGQCWVLPAKCPPSFGGQAWGLCSDPHPVCTDACSAIRSEVSYRSLPGSLCP